MDNVKKNYLLFTLLVCVLAGCGNDSSAGKSARDTSNGLVMKDSYSTTGETYGWVGHVELVDLAERVIVTGSYTVTQIQLFMHNVGSPNQDIVAGIYSHDAANDQPGSLLGTWSAPVNNANFPSSAPGASVFFTGLNVPLTPGTYWIVLRVVSGTGDNGWNYTIASGTTERERGECHLNTGWNEFMFAQVLYAFYSEN